MKTRDSDRGSFDYSGFQEVEFLANPRPGTALVEWLNTRRNSRVAQSIVNLIQKISRLQYLEGVHKRTLWAEGSRLVTSKRGARRRGTFWETYDHRWTDDYLRRFESEDPIFAEICRLNMDIAQQLNMYRFVPRVQVSALGTRVAWVPLQDRQPQTPSKHVVKYSMVPGVLRLAERGQLNCIAQCENCGKWLSSRRPGFQKFCTAKCQQTHYKSSPDWKGYRAEYMRRYRKISGTGGK